VVQREHQCTNSGKCISHPLCRDDRGDDVLAEALVDDLVGDVVVVLGRDDNSVHALGDGDAVNLLVPGVCVCGCWLLVVGC
jgi:hypothetical protein